MSGEIAGTTVARFAVPVPEDIDPVLAAAVSSPVLTSLLPLKYSVGLKPGETVWVNGATGFTGRLAVAVARMLGAGAVVGTGRNAASLEKLREAGCDRLIDLSLEDGRLVITPLVAPQYSLADLLAQISPENRHTEVDTGSSVGREAW